VEVMREPIEQPFPDFDQIDSQAQHKIAEIRRLVAPDLRPLTGRPIAADADRRLLDQLEPLNQELIALKLSLAFADLTDLQEALRQYRDLIVAELRRHHQGRSAAASYAFAQQQLKISRQH
jgi:hypothetical protein